MIGPLMRKLEQLGPLDDQERRLLESLPLNSAVRYGAGQDIAREGDRPGDCKLIVEGFACRYRQLEDGKRQIVSFHLPGDLVDLTSLLLGRMDHGIAAITPVEAVAIPHAVLLDWTERYPRLAQMLWRDTLVDAAIFREWVVNIGRRSAHQRIAHLLCELVTRMRAAGLAPPQDSGDPCDLPPITQGNLADATGLSVVHVNRTIQQLRAEGLVDMRGRTLVALDWNGLRRAAGFDPAYLHRLADAA